jgi:RNA polymerase sigma-70 factor (ECF subfamily)
MERGKGVLSMQELKDEELILAYQNGEATAMDEILRRYKNPIYRFILRLCGNSSEAEDFAQEVFLRLHQFKDTYQPTGKFSTWLFSIAHNLVISRLRRLKWWVLWPRKNDETEELVEFPSPDPSPEDIATENEISKLVQASLQSLPFLQKEALILREYENLNYEEIGKILKKSLGAVKTLIHRARENLKVKLLPLRKEFKEV